MDSHSTNGYSDEQLADLARLVDGTLPADRRAELQVHLAESPEAASIVARQEAALDALRGTADTGAPARLRARVERRGTAPVARRRLPALLSGGLATAAAAAFALFFVALPGASGLSMTGAAALADKPWTQPAPGAVAAKPQLLNAKVDGVPFPNFAAKFSWRPVGAREDAPSGRRTRTVYYTSGGRTVAYTIVAGGALHPPSSSSSITRDGVDFRTFAKDGRTVVTWQRRGHTCVLSATGVPSSDLIALADWRGKGAIPF